MSIAPEVITKILSCRERAVEWWIMETDHRKRYGLSVEQIQTLVDLLAKTFPKPVRAG
jgi:hypothetical protein